MGHPFCKFFIIHPRKFFFRSKWCRIWFKHRSCSCTFSVFVNNKQKMDGPCTSPHTPKIHIYQYILDIKHFQQISWYLSQVPLETPQIIWNNPISDTFISLVSDIIPFTTAQSHYYADDAWTSNACTRAQFLNTITKKNWKI